jgi:hypothetical protein
MREKPYFEVSSDKFASRIITTAVCGDTRGSAARNCEVRQKYCMVWLCRSQSHIQGTFTVVLASITVLIYISGKNSSTSEIKVFWNVKLFRCVGYKFWAEVLPPPSRLHSL